MRKLASLLLSLVSIAGAASAFAQTDYPTRPVRIVVAQGAGGSPDVLARLMAQELTHRFGQPFVVQNMPGAAGTIGTSHVAKAAPDGYTLLVTTEASLVTNVRRRRRSLRPGAGNGPADDGGALHSAGGVASWHQQCLLPSTAPYQTVGAHLKGFGSGQARVDHKCHRI